MAVQWFKTNYLGVRYRQHHTRKVGKYFDRCFSIRYRVQGKLREEVAGWTSEGMTAHKAYLMLLEKREQVGKGEPSDTPPEKATSEEAHAPQDVNLSEANENHPITIDDYFTNTYVPNCLNTKTQGTMFAEKCTYKNWIKDSIGDIYLNNLKAKDIEKIILVANKKNKSPQTIRHIIAIISQIWNMAFAHDLVNGINPCYKIKKPYKDSRRVRFLTPEEATNLLEKIKDKSLELYHESILSLFAGLRAGEIHNLHWSDINFDNKSIYIRDPKNKHSRHAYFTPELESILLSKKDESQKKIDNLVFPSRSGKMRTQISASFKRIVEEIGLNEGISDPRQKVVFHTLRHTFASWLVQK